MLNKTLLNSSSKRKFLKVFCVSLLGSLGYGIFNYRKNNINKSTWNGSVLGAPSSIEIHSKDQKLNNYMIETINKQVLKYENIFNIQNKNSEINFLNKNKVLNNPSFELMDVINKSQFISSNTDGLFDITVQPLWNLYFDHFITENNKISPNKNKLKNALKLVDWKNVVIKDKRIVLKNNASITLNGIAQGWITDQITTLLSSKGFNDKLVDFGENYASGLYQRERPWNILIKGNKVEKLINLSNKAIATSGGYGTIFEASMKHHHIFNTNTGESSNNFKSVSIISNKAWLSDAISTASLSMNKESLKKLCKKVKARAIVQENKNFVEIT